MKTYKKIKPSKNDDHSNQSNPDSFLELRVRKFYIKFAKRNIKYI